MTRRSRAVALAAIILGVAGPLLAAAANRGATARRRPATWPPPSARAAVRAEPPADAVTASDEAEFSRMLEGPAGPRAIRLLPRVYRGDFKVRRALSLHGEGATLEGTGTGTVLDVEASDVLVEGLTLRGSGHRHTTEDAGIRARGARVHVSDVTVDSTLFGISLQECKACTVERAHVIGAPIDVAMRGDGVKLWESDDSVVRDSLVERSRDIVVWYSRRVHLENNLVRGSRYGTHFMYAHDSVVRGSRMTDNTVGVFVMYSTHLHAEDNVMAGARGAAGVGIGFKESDGVVVTGNMLVGNTVGAYLDRTPRSPDDPVTLAHNVFALNDVALRFHGASVGLSALENDFRRNGEAAAVDGGGDAMAVSFSHNYWSDYEGYDLDGDGLGDVPFEERRLSSELSDTHPSLSFFRGTAAMGLVDALSLAMPIFASRLVLVDPAPSLLPHRATR